MELENAAVLALVGAAVLVPLGLEYADLRRASGLGRRAALATTLFILPALGIGIAGGVPFAARPVLQWTVIVVLTLVVYSFAVGAVRAAAEPEPARARRR